MKILLIDIETAPTVAYIWGPKNPWISPDHIVTPGYTLCFAAKWYGEKETTYWSAHHNGADEMIQAAWDLLHEADAVVHYNGSSFDIPTLQADFIERGMPPPSPAHDIDLLKTSRRCFRRYSHKLDEVSKWLGLGKKHPHKGMGLWAGCMAGNERDWNTMRTYNIQDVRLLERVYDAFMPWIKSHPNHALYANIDKPVCVNCGSENVIKEGQKTTGTQVYQQYSCKGCGKWSRGRINITPEESRPHILVAA